MKKIFTLTIAAMFLLSAAGWTFDNSVYSQKSLKSSICSVDNTNKVLSYTNKTTQTNLNAPNAKSKMTKVKKGKEKMTKGKITKGKMTNRKMTNGKRTIKKLIHKSTTLTKKTVHKVGKKTITTIETTPVNP